MPLVRAGRKYLGMSRNTAYSAARAGQIPAFKICGRWFVSIPAMEKMLQSGISFESRTKLSTEENRAP
jgi:hypothetical protein